MLYFVATPIGNISEITFRAIETLKAVDYIYAEDTRHSGVLMSHYEIRTPMYPYQKFNEKAKCDEIVSKLKSGKNIAVISDAGMPLISDPGFILVERLIEEGLEYTVVSGASACINALILSGFSTLSFCMAGFLPQKTSDKEQFIGKFKELESTLIFYVPPHDALKELEFLHKHLGARKAAVVREISKKFETVHRGILGEDFSLTEKGEMVIVVEGAKEKAGYDEKQTPLEHLQELINGGMEKKEAVKTVAKLRNLPKNDVYKLIF